MPVRVVETDPVVVRELVGDRVSSADRVPVRDTGPETLEVGVPVLPADRDAVREEEIVAVPEFVAFTDTVGVELDDVDFVLVTLRVAVPVGDVDRVDDAVRDPVAVPVGLRVPVTLWVEPADFEAVLLPEADVEGLRVEVAVRVALVEVLGDRVPVVVRVITDELVPVREEDIVAVVDTLCKDVFVDEAERVMTAVPVAV